ncbi:hypothetical protein OHA98_33195 [Streptomyces sp. NBC_00654]|uniref:hypothetical protein n=1 Tax=Streptomyces sp. NBC_00654 TaxID=2975799 RepID=UPI00224E97AC|nr:hypothetical protein [Streptomyces sp. NBC_00654]MCX4969531.1 hypothetical protein [Streptomyces sp. NBC_00654]
MRRGLVHAIAWTLATGAAVTLSWWGVHTVLAESAYDPPLAVPIAVGARPERTGPADAEREPVASSTRRASPSAPPRASGSRDGGGGGTGTGGGDGTGRNTSGLGATSSSPSPRPPRKPSPTAAKPSAPAGEVKGYRTDGGRVVLELGRSSAKLVTATPEPGWSMQVWTNDAWIRVDFSDGNGRTDSVFCTWNGHPPTVQVVEP